MTADLMAKLEGAEAGSRELSDAVLLACGWTTGAHKTLDQAQAGKALVPTLRSHARE